MRVSHKLAFGLAAVALLATACTSDGPDDVVSGGSSSEPVEQIESTSSEGTPSALRNMTAEGLPDPLVDPGEVISGGPPPDGIPPIDDPKFLTAGEVDFLEDDEPVLSLEIDGETRAYPIQIMIWHEIVNDTLGETPVTVSYCPLCNTGVAFDRRLGDRVLDFGTSGKLYQSALVMYDRQTESLWSHFTGEAIAGVLTAEVLTRIPVATVSWRDWLAANPDGMVLSKDTGESRPYGQNPYPGYDGEKDPFLFNGEIDDRLEAKERVVGTGVNTDPTAIVTETLLAEGPLTFDLDGTAVVAWALPGTASALDQSDVADGRDVGATGVFETNLDGRELTFSRTEGAFTDRETNSTWNVLGQAVGGPLEGSRLTARDHVDTFWFAWAAFAPDTQLIR
ncbi:MAG: DUF3179 domain-containing protein [Microthrixaceae bacterium]